MHPQGLFGMSAYTQINSFGIALAFICVIIMILVEWRRRKREGLPSSDLPRRKRPNPLFFFLCYLVAYVVLVPGAYVAGQLFNITVVLEKVTLFSGGGVAFASGVLLFIPVFLLMAKIFPGNGTPARQLELVLPSLALNHVFNRLACLMGGCCFGVPCESFGVIYPDSAAASHTYGAGTRVFPNLLLESSIMLVCFVVMLILHYRGKRTLPIFPMVFGATGFVLGFFMNHDHEPLKPIFGFTYPTPFTHLLVFFVGVIFLVLVIREKKRGAATPPPAQEEAQA